jgi:hypothetical protein
MTAHPSLRITAAQHQSITSVDPTSGKNSYQNPSGRKTTISRIASSTIASSIIIDLVSAYRTNKVIIKDRVLKKLAKQYAHTYSGNKARFRIIKGLHTFL